MLPDPGQGCQLIVSCCHLPCSIRHLEPLSRGCMRGWKQVCQGSSLALLCQKGDSLKGQGAAAERSFLSIPISPMAAARVQRAAESCRAWMRQTEPDLSRCHAGVWETSVAHLTGSQRDAHPGLRSHCRLSRHPSLAAAAVSSLNGMLALVPVTDNCFSHRKTGLPGPALRATPRMDGATSD